MGLRTAPWTRAAGRLWKLAAVGVLLTLGGAGLPREVASAAPAPSLALSPTSGPVGTAVSATGYNFTASAKGSLTFNGTAVANLTTDRKGNFSARFSVPVAPSTSVTVMASVGRLSATKPFTVTSLASSTTSSTTVTTVPSPPTTSGTVLFGVSTPSGAHNLSELDAFEASARKRVGLLMYFQGWAYDEFNSGQAAAVSARGAIPEITWEPWDYRAGLDQPTYSLSSIIGGAHDPYITRWAQGAKAHAGPILVRFAHEMNDRHYPWSEVVNGNGPGQYVAAWRHVVDIFRAVGATNVKWVWSPNVSYAGTTPLAQLYPGDGYVDWVAVDGYNGGTALPWGGWLSFTQVFATTLAELASVAPTKPVMIGETASTEHGGSKPTWIREFFAELAQRPQIQGFVWFNHNKETDWRIESSATSTEAFATGVADPRYR